MVADDIAEGYVDGGTVDSPSKIDTSPISPMLVLFTWSQNARYVNLSSSQSFNYFLITPPILFFQFSNFFSSMIIATYGFINLSNLLHV